MLRSLVGSEMCIRDSIIIQCEANAKFRHLQIASYLESLVGTEFFVYVSPIDRFINRRHPDISLVTISASYPGKDYIEKHGEKALSKTALFIYDTKNHAVIDAITTDDYVSSQGLVGPKVRIRLDFGESHPPVLATPNGFVVEK